MRSRVARWIITAIALVAVAASAAFLYRSEKQIAASTLALRAFDLHAREATDALADVRSAQQAYVAAGQGVTFWMPKVATTTDSITTALRTLRQSATSETARAALDRAASTVNDFVDVDQRARDYLRSGQQLMAGDVIFTEGTESAARAAREVESSRLSEHQAFDQAASQARRVEAMVLAGAAAIALIALLLLARLPAAEPVAATVALPGPPVEEESSARVIPSAPQSAASPRVTSSTIGPILKNAADLVTEMGRARDLTDLERSIARAADLMDASGVVLWIGSTTGADLRPVLAHGYTPQVLARMPAVPRTADNAAAAAYRSGAVQIVLSRPGRAGGAIVAPILTADGCVGALSAEIRDGGEGSETVQGLAAILAAQLANVVSAPAEGAARETKTASA